MCEGTIKSVFVLPSLVRAGAETQVINLVNGLDKERFEKHLFVFERQLDLLNHIDYKQVQFHHHPRHYKFDIAPAIHLARIINNRHIDIVHCSLQIALFFGWFAIRIAHHKPHLVLTLHTTVSRNLHNELFNKFLYQWLMRSCKQVICVCKAQESYWQAKYPFLRGRTTVIYNGVDTEWFKEKNATAEGAKFREQYGISKDAFVACCIAAFRPEKGHHYLLDAFRKVFCVNPNIYLLLVGDGPLRVKMEMFTKKSGLSDRVIFLGVMNDVRTVLAASAISIIASTAVETFSMAMLESMAMKVPIVATDIGGTREAVITTETGFLVPPRDVLGLASAIIEALTNRERLLKIGNNARQHVIKCFTKQRMIETTGRLMLEI